MNDCLTILEELHKDDPRLLIKFLMREGGRTEGSARNLCTRSTGISALVASLPVAKILNGRGKSPHVIATVAMAEALFKAMPSKITTQAQHERDILKDFILNVSDSHELSLDRVVHS